MNGTKMWWLSLGASTAVVGVVAGLLGKVAAEARSIDEHAEGIWTVGKQIAGNTVSIWMLEGANDQLAKTLDVAGRIEGVAASIDAKLGALAGGTNGTSGTGSAGGKG